MAANTINTPDAAMAIVFIATFFVGWNEALVLPMCTMCIPDQSEIGTATGIAGSSRSAISTVASTVYSVVLTARIGQTIPAQVPNAVIGAGLPETSVQDYFTAMTAGGTPELLASVPGLTPAIQEAGALAYRLAYMEAYRTIFYVSIAFGVLCIIVSFFIQDMDQYMTSAIAATLQGRKDGTTIAEKVHHENITV